MKRFLGPAALVWLSCSAAACALTAPAPGGALRPGTTTQLEPSWAIAYGGASASVRGVPIQGNGQTFAGPTGGGAIVPLRVGLRQALGSAVEAGADVGWLDSGLELRAGSGGGDDDGALPFSIMAEFRSRRLALAWGEETYEGRLRVEIDPDISSASDGSRRLILAAGVSGGHFAHALMLPSSLRSEGGDAPDFRPTGAIFVRPEVRLELAIGVELRHHLDRAAATFVLAPWILLGARAPIHTACSDCEPGAMLTDFSQGWGVSFIVTPKIAGDPLARLLGG